MHTEIYVSALTERYASKEMQYLFSKDMKFCTWRKLWVALAEAERELELIQKGEALISQEQIEEMKAYVNNVNYDVAQEKEKEIQHDVMSHIYAFGQQCPKAAGIIHLGATSSYVVDNTDIIVMTEALKVIRRKIFDLIKILTVFAEKQKAQPTLAYTHLQPAQPTTVGKRACMWIQEFYFDLEDLEHVLKSMKLLGTKGASGTQASYVELFEGENNVINQIDQMIAEKMGFQGCYTVTGQTYSRKIDMRVLNILAGVATSAHKMSNDIRFLQHLGEVEEPYEQNQVGSSAMTYKRNPIKCERIASLARYVIVDALNPAITSATQWLERTLDDSANKRISIPEAFLALDGILDLCIDVIKGLKVYPKVIEKNLLVEFPFMIGEKIIINAVRRGENRQDVHERLRIISMNVKKGIKEDGEENNLFEMIADEPIFHTTRQELDEMINPEKYVGCAEKQVERFLLEIGSVLMNR